MTAADESRRPLVTADRWELFRSQAETLCVALQPSQMESFRRYLALLCEWNRRFNLTAVADPNEVLTKHFLDSLSCALVVDWTAQRTLIDVGSGAGFPGIPLAIAYPHLEVVLLDSVDKRVRFCGRVAADLGLERVRPLHARAEEAAHDPALRERFDVAVARALARLNVLAEWCVPFVRPGGLFLAMKGPEVIREVEEASAALRILGGGAVQTRSLILPGAEVGRSLVVIPKAGPTPAAYPRRTGAARKRPL